MRTAPVLPESEVDQKTPARVWALVISAVFLLHFLLILFQRHWPVATAPQRVEVTQIDSSKLDAIRKQWRERDKALLLNKDKNLPKDQEAPADARYYSDRNIRVDREQRARETNVIPKPNTRRQEAAPSEPNPARQQGFKQPGSLSQFGVPMNLGAPARERSAPSQERGLGENKVNQEGGDQAILDRQLPEGSENLLNAQESVYYSFYARLYEAIGPIWQSHIRSVPQARRVPEGEYSTLVDVVLDPSSGRVAEVRLMTPSGIPEFDEAVNASWKKVGKFPNPPKDLIQPDGYVHTGWTFTVVVGAGFNMQYLPPERNY